MIPLVTLVVLSLAAYRLTTLITTDSITRPLRQAFARRFPPSQPERGENTERIASAYDVPVEMIAGRPHPIVVLVNCGRCLGFWMSGIVVAVARAFSVDLGGTPWVLVWWAVAGAVTLLVTLTP